MKLIELTLSICDIVDIYGFTVDLGYKDCPLFRSKRTAAIIWGTRDAPMIPDIDPREVDLYSFQGLLKHEGKEKFGPPFHQRQVDAPNFVIDHYPVMELWARARSCWDRILAHQSKFVLVLAHNAVNQALIATTIGNFVKSC